LKRKIRVIIAKAGLDGHDRGAKVIAAAFRDSGIEVIYLGLRQSPEMIVEAALQEDADAIGISILSGAHMTIFKKINEQMKLKGLNDVLLFGGGIIPKEDISKLKEIGVGELFTPGTPTHDTIDYVKKWVKENRKSVV
jgi:methylmalonyl-CoA mutase C-terminal domain/subunit